MVLTSKRVEVPRQLSLKSNTSPARASSKALLALASLRCRRSTGVSPTATEDAAATAAAAAHGTPVIGNPVVWQTTGPSLSPGAGGATQGSGDPLGQDAQPGIEVQALRLDRMRLDPCQVMMSDRDPVPEGRA